MNELKGDCIRRGYTDPVPDLGRRGGGQWVSVAVSKKLKQPNCRFGKKKETRVRPKCARAW